VLLLSGDVDQAEEAARTAHDLSNALATRLVAEGIPLGKARTLAQRGADHTLRQHLAGEQ
jgi:hypothetical protein